MNPRILYIAPLEDFSGYATAARDYLTALHKAGCDMVARSLHYDGGQYKFAPDISSLFKKSLSKVDIVIQHTTPNETEKKQGVFNCNYFAWETDRVPEEWVNQLNQMDLVLVPCKENIRAARKSGVIVPIEQIPHTFDMNKYKREYDSYYLEGKDEVFKILAICQISKKKGLEVLLKSYLSEFSQDDKTLLILKVYFGPNDGPEERERMVAQVNKIKETLRLPNYPRVLIVHQIMSEEEIYRLYSTSDCYALPSRGEGWSIPHFDAMGFGKPPIAVNWGGPTEFITKDTGWLTKFTMSPVCDMPHPHPYMYTARDNWAEPDVLDFRKAMREAHFEWLMHKNDPTNSRWSQRISAGLKRVEDFKHENIGPLMRDVIYHYYKKAV